MDFRAPTENEESDAAILDEPYRPFYNILGSKPILVKQYEVASMMTRFNGLISGRNNDYDRVVFRERPFLGVLLFDNVSSDARDHAANERSKYCSILGHRIVEAN
jgi:hypothetical protein